jgi:hypothetical protein
LLTFLIRFVGRIDFVDLPGSLQGTLVDGTQALGFLTLLLALFILGIRWLGLINHALVALNSPHVVLHVLLSFFVPLYGVAQTFLLSTRLDKLEEDSVTYGRLCIV